MGNNCEECGWPREACDCDYSDPVRRSAVLGRQPSPAESERGGRSGLDSLDVIPPRDRIDPDSHQTQAKSLAPLARKLRLDIVRALSALRSVQYWREIKRWSASLRAILPGGGCFCLGFHFAQLGRGCRKKLVHTREINPSLGLCKRKVLGGGGGFCSPSPAQSRPNAVVSDRGQGGSDD